MKRQRKGRTPREGNKSSSSRPKDTVGVYCRLKPRSVEDQECCVEMVNKTTVLVHPPHASTTFHNHKELQYTFKKVFPSHVQQEEVFDVTAKLLVQDLLQGKNGLLFTYGVTGAGKTYTMTGSPGNPGLLPRCLNMVFHTISHCQAMKYVFKPDGKNGMDIQDEVDALLERQKEMPPSLRPKTPSKSKADSGFSGIKPCKADNIAEESLYGVFVSYVEIYNNCIYDLLDDTDPIKSKSAQPKNLKEDCNHNMYVAGCIEVQVTSIEEAIEVFWRGQKQRRVASTKRNRESSRSHGTFLLRLAQAPLDSDCHTLLQDKKMFVTVSQLALVDLAGSERASRTGAEGSRLREAGCINTSLMTLRTCIEILRENQLLGTNKMVRYRETKLTHLLKKYFDGEGTVKMVICVDPKTDVYKETLHVMCFAELMQEVEVTRPMEKPIMGLTPGRRGRRNALREEISRPLEEHGGPVQAFCGVELSMTVHEFPPFPSLELTGANDTVTLTCPFDYMEERQRIRRLAQDEVFRAQSLGVTTIGTQECSSFRLFIFGFNCYRPVWT
uniref:kinesin-like protein KIF23 n=1 Tax=Myxine glutinosa TaxID=7769 RepID=UPI00358FDEAA